MQIEDAPEEIDESTNENGGGQHSRFRALVSLGAELTGGAAGGALGFILGGPVGAAAAGVGGVAITRTLLAAGEEVCDRILSPRERVRVGAAIAVSAATTKERLEAGALPRDDGFLDDGSDRPPVEEVTDGLLLAAQRAYDEKKVPYIGRLSANLNFRPDLDVRAASVLVRMADELSFQELCLLRLAYDNEHGRPLAGGKYHERFKSTAHAALLSDLLDLERRGYVNNGGEAVLGMTDLDPTKVRLQAFGAHLLELMQLQLIPEEELQPLRAAFEAPDAVFVSITSREAAAQFRLSSPSDLIVRRSSATGDDGSAA